MNQLSNTNDAAGESPSLAPPAADQARLAKWQAHLAARGVSVPDETDFRSFGSLSTLERLRTMLADHAPEQCGPLRRAISDLGREKRQGSSNAKGGARGPEIRLSIPKDQLRDDWRVVVDEMRARATRLEAGLLILQGPRPPAPSLIRDTEYVLRAVSKTCIDVGTAPELSKVSIAAWLDREEARGRRATGLSLQLRLLAKFLNYASLDRKLAKRLKKLAADYARRGRRRKKLKFTWLDQHKIEIGHVWDIAEDLLAESRTRRAGTMERYTLALHAAAIALSVNMPLRIGDLSRLLLGRDISRSAYGWSVQTKIRKTDGEYDLPDLWPETAKFLDELLILDAPGADLWFEYDRRNGTPLFSEDGGRTGLSADWISDVYYEHVGTGAHIIRTLWHQLAYESDRDLGWMALALCGQRGARTKREYRERNARGKTVRVGRKSLSDLRQRAIAEARAAGTLT